MNILIVTGGNIDIDFALDFLKEKKFDEVIAVDGALAFFEKVGEQIKKCGKLTHIVGDFDTISPEILKKYQADGRICCHSFNPEKDYTDTDIALKLAQQLICNDGGRGSILILGGTGTRLDHTLANIQMLIGPMKKGIECVIADSHNRIRMIRKQAEVTEPFGKYISLIPVTECLKGVDLEGFKYPLTDRTVYLGESLCVSNELTGAEGKIRIREGIALLIESKD